MSQLPPASSLSNVESTPAENDHVDLSLPDGPWMTLPSEGSEGSVWFVFLLRQVQSSTNEEPLMFHRQTLTLKTCRGFQSSQSLTHQRNQQKLLRHTRTPGSCSSGNTHTLTHARTHTHSYRHAHTHIFTQIQTLTHTHTQIHTYTQIQTHTLS